MTLDLSAIRARLKAATPGPWRNCKGSEGDKCICGIVWMSDEEHVLAHCGPNAEDNGATRGPERVAEDADFIAHAPEDIRHLLAIAERLYADERRYRQGTVRDARPGQGARRTAWHGSARVDRKEWTMTAPKLTVACRQCSRTVEPERECYATPVCFVCLPPPAPLPVRPTFEQQIRDELALLREENPKLRAELTALREVDRLVRSVTCEDDVADSLRGHTQGMALLELLRTGEVPSDMRKASTMPTVDLALEIERLREVEKAARAFFALHSRDHDGCVERDPCRQKCIALDNALRRVTT